MNLISFSGRMKTGKSISCDLICDVDPRFKKISFAGPLKDMYCKKYKVDRKLLDDVIEKEKHREAIQQMGDEERSKNPYVFAIALTNKLIPSSFYCIEDTRYLEEIEVLIKLGAKCYGVTAEPKIRAERGWNHSPADNHLSETELGDLCAHTWYSLGGGLVYNNGTKDQLRGKLSEILRKHFPYTITDLESLGKVKKATLW